MLFNSLNFAFFFIIVFLLYYFIPSKFRWILLLAASYYFYMSWNPKLIILILTTTTVTYISGILIEKGKHKKTLLLLSLLTCLGILFYYKYFNFFEVSLSKVLSLVSIELSSTVREIILPVGISFYTFQTLSYVIDVYRGRIKSEKHFGIYALFVSFFPQLVAGPIERPDHLIPQLKRDVAFDYNKAVYGAKLMIVGFFKKIVIADPIAMLVNTIYQDYNRYPYVMAIGTLLFAFQIYCDFSGYTDIAIGCAKILGVDIAKNFAQPYFSKNIKEFWARWHISLSSWFRDYLYIPLGGNRVAVPRYYFNLLITFLISGLWHGASWKFVLWGAFHGILLILYDGYSKLKKFEKNRRTSRLKDTFSRMLTFVLVCFGWVLFRINSFSSLKEFLRALLKPLSYSPGQLKIFLPNEALGLTWIKIISIIVPIIVLSVYDYFSLKYDLILESAKMKKGYRLALYQALVLVLFVYIIVAHISNANNEFIYFQF